ncbi:MAG: hypothetical protein RIB60_05330 [Phycisphaerales bacterium]
MTRTSSSPYEIGHPIGTCSHTGDALVPGDAFVAVVVEAPDGTLARADFSAKAWDDGARPGAPIFAAWRSVVPDPNEKPKPLIDDGELMDIFEREVSDDDDTRLAFRYLIGLVLIRKRKLVYEGGTPADAKKGTRGTMRVRVPGKTASGEKHPITEVIDPGLSDERAAELAEQLDVIMNEDGSDA